MKHDLDANHAEYKQYGRFGAKYPLTPTTKNKILPTST
jgi:hypothetical protein